MQHAVLAMALAVLFCGPRRSASISARQEIATHSGPRLQRKCRYAFDG
jgi:hypothetical protein